MTSSYNLYLPRGMAFITLWNQQLPSNFTSTERYDPFDFVSTDKTTFIELKTRNFTADTYDTTIVGFSKVLHANKAIIQNPKVSFYFVFGFYTDGEPPDYRYWKFDRQQARQFDRIDVKGVSHVKIPIISLRPLADLIEELEKMI